MAVKELKPQRGFTLIEIIAGIVVVGIITLVVTTGMGPLFKQSVNPWQQVRAAELGQSLINEILSRRFDENGSSAVGEARCGETGGPSCTTIPSDCSNTSYREEASRENFDDVDDYHCLELSGNQVADTLANDLTDDYRQFRLQVRVAVEQPDRLKRIEVTVITPQGQNIDFSAFRGNW
ncbi:MAG: Pilin protein [Idiomarina sp. T82-3]|uniref:type IV pilus modification PilV family protein n=1 Tax=Idiomarina TaxID=135575 RepID=UPI00079595CE|nr:type II secretion system protein [Idiomarina sp. T82-3]KXS36590.1 MAG: Pilin protein [Idiomarina sp. T82-3]